MRAHHLVVGAGPVGRHVASLLIDRGDRVIVGSRSGRDPGVVGAEHVVLDASSADALARAADGVDGLFNTANPGTYATWEKRWPPLAASLLAVAEKTGAVYAMTGNLYPLGPVDGPLREDLPDIARDHKGSLRARIWAEALAAHTAGRVRAFEVRGSDFVGGGEGHVSRVLPTALRGRAVRMVGRVDQPHTFTHVGDVARVLVAAFHDHEAHGRVWHVPSNPPRTQREIVDELMDAAGRPRVAVRGTSAALILTLGLVSPLLREVSQLSYQLTRPYVLDGTAAQERFGIAPTPWEDVLRLTLDAARGGDAHGG
jgi:nucleoside-diphosphate-sugar epimerase